MGDFVWRDTNGNGVQDPGEVGVGGVTVRLLDASGNVVATTVTDVTGHYVFSGLPAGEYSVEFVLPGGFTFGPAGQGNKQAAVGWWKGKWVRGGSCCWAGTVWRSRGR